MTTPLFTPTLLPHLLEQMRTAVVCITHELEVVYANSAAEMLFYVSHTRLIGTPITTFFTESHDVDSLVARALAQHHVFSLRNVALAPHYLRQYTTHVDIMVSPLSLPALPTLTNAHEHQGSYLLLELTARDRQSRIANEPQLNQQHEATRQMIRGVAHEIKNPLAGIRGAAQLLQRSIEQHAHEKNSDHTEYTRVIINESDRLSELANSMLGSHNGLNVQPSNIHEPLEHVCTLIASQFDGIQLKRDYDISLPDIYVDSDKLIQVFLNISLNAAQALSEHKQSISNLETWDATLTLKTRIAHHITINGTMHRQLIVVSIIDNGPGIPEHIQKTLFYPMVSGRASGTGLGLSIAHDIVQQHGGLLRFDDDGGNTRFDVVLPLSTTQAASNTHNIHKQTNL